jgi:hypothetical protein
MQVLVPPIFGLSCEIEVFSIKFSCFLPHFYNIPLVSMEVYNKHEWNTQIGFSGFHESLWQVQVRHVRLVSWFPWKLATNVDEACERDGQHSLTMSTKPFVELGILHQLAKPDLKSTETVFLAMNMPSRFIRHIMCIQCIYI